MNFGSNFEQIWAGIEWISFEIVSPSLPSLTRFSFVSTLIFFPLSLSLIFSYVALRLFSTQCKYNNNYLAWLPFVAVGRRAKLPKTCHKLWNLKPQIRLLQTSDKFAKIFLGPGPRRRWFWLWLLLWRWLCGCLAPRGVCVIKLHCMPACCATHWHTHIMNVLLHYARAPFSFACLQLHLLPPLSLTCPQFKARACIPQRSNMPHGIAGSIDEARRKRNSIKKPTGHSMHKICK